MLISPDLMPFGGYLLGQAIERRSSGPEPEAQVGQWLGERIGSSHDLTPAQVRRVLADRPVETLDAAEAAWQEAHGWTHGYIHGCACFAFAEHRDWTAMARCRWPKASRVVDLAGFQSNPEFRVAWWSSGQTTVLVTTNCSLANPGHDCDWQLAGGRGSLRRVRVDIAAGVSLDPFDCGKLARRYPYWAVEPLLDQLGVRHASHIWKAEDAAWFRDSLGILAEPLPPREPYVPRPVSEAHAVDLRESERAKRLLNARRNVRQD